MGAPKVNVALKISGGALRVDDKLNFESRMTQKVGLSIRKDYP